MGNRYIPSEFKEETIWFTLPYINISFTSKAVIYCLIATGISAIFLKINIIVFFLIFIILNSIAFPLATGKTSDKKFEAGNLPYDKFLIRKYKYKYRRNIYLRKRGE